tara:strand:+ start:559 stop:1128 length:570 start_codon:yes stop_codon:yes gene_type:complete
MKKLIILFLFLSFSSFSQNSGAKDYSQARSIITGKKWIIDNVFGGADMSPKKIYIDALAGDTYSDLTTIYYKSGETEGLVLGLFASVQNEFGNRYWMYDYTNFNKEDAISFFNIVDEIKDSQKSYLNDKSENNIYFKISDLVFLLNIQGGYKIKVFWDEYRADWDGSSFEKSRRRFERSLSKSSKGKIN